jgi:hypothetical protein
MKSLEDILLFLDMKCRMLGLAVSKYMIVSVCVVFCFVRIPMVVLVSKGGKYSQRYLHSNNGLVLCNTKPSVDKELSSLVFLDFLRILHGAVMILWLRELFIISSTLNWLPI